MIFNCNLFQSVPIPWKSILTSRPFWALVFAQCAMNFGFYTLLTQIPSYLAYFMQFDIKTVTHCAAELRKRIKIIAIFPIFFRTLF